MAEAHSPVLVRMETELKEALAKAGKSAGRTLTGEINTRLRNSFVHGVDLVPPAAPAGKKGAKYPVGHAPTVAQVNAAVHADLHLSEVDKALLQIVRSMPPEKQLALLSLFK